jgi:hypothetical protein
MSVKRYAMEIQYRPGQPAGMESPDPVLAENEAGNLVLFSDYEALWREREAMRLALEEARDHLYDKQDITRVRAIAAAVLKPPYSEAAN